MKEEKEYEQHENLCQTTMTTQVNDEAGTGAGGVVDAGANADTQRETTTTENKAGEQVQPAVGSSSSESTNGTLNGSHTSVEEPGAPVAKEQQSRPADPEASRTKLQTFIIMLSLCSSVFLA